MRHSLVQVPYKGRRYIVCHVCYKHEIINSEPRHPMFGLSDPQCGDSIEDDLVDSFVRLVDGVRTPLKVRKVYP